MGKPKPTDRIIVKVFAYKDTHLVVCPQILEERKRYFWPIDEGKCGSTLADTKVHLAISKKAIGLIDRMKRNRDAIGDIDWFISGDKKVFGWFGALFRVVDIRTCEAARGTRVYPDDCVIIPNRLTKEMTAACVAGDYMWKTPYSLDHEGPSPRLAALAPT